MKRIIPYFNRPLHLPERTPMATESFRYLLAFGSNKGQREKHFQTGLSLLAKTGLLRWKSRELITAPLSSPLYDTSSHETYLNMVADWETHLAPPELYYEISQIEDFVGHDRKKKWQPRELDIDLLFWAKNDASIFTDCSRLLYHMAGGSLQVPHPDFWKRQFLQDLAGEYPGINLDVLRNVSLGK